MPERVTHQEVENADFSVAIRGFDKEEVRTFLARVADTLRYLEDSAQSAYQRLGEEVGNLLQDARDSADQMRRVTEEEMGRLQEEAVTTAAKTIEEAQREASALRTSAEEEVSARLQEAEDKVLQLRAAEQDVREQLRWLRMNLQTVVEQLHAVESGQPAERAPGILEPPSGAGRQSEGHESSLSETQPQEVTP